MEKIFSVSLIKETETKCPRCNSALSEREGMLATCSLKGTGRIEYCVYAILPHCQKCGFYFLKKSQKKDFSPKDRPYGFAEAVFLQNICRKKNL